MHAVKVFVDSNVLLYTRDASLIGKARTASDWLRRVIELNLACTNLQVLNETTHVMLRKRRDLSADEIFLAVDELGFLGSTPIDENHVAVARELRKATQYSWWDCLLLVSAIELGCTYFLSEDLQDGRQIAGLTIVDPFAHTPEQILASL
jgi:predicted nucleic acid-binding protein